VDDVVVGAMSAQNAIKFFTPGTLLITPGDREDIVLAAGASLESRDGPKMAGIILTGGLRPSDKILDIIHFSSAPFMLVKDDSYQVASKVNNLIVKTRPSDSEKISLIRDIVAKNINVKKICWARAPRAGSGYGRLSQYCFRDLSHRHEIVWSEPHHRSRRKITATICQRCSAPSRRKRGSFLWRTPTIPPARSRRARNSSNSSTTCPTTCCW
jgi:hypothetical protein